MKSKIEKIARNCVNCIIAERKRGKSEGFLNQLDKGDRPFDTYRIDHLNHLTPTKKRYQYIFAVTDAFTKFLWLYPTKSTGAEEVISRLKKQAVVFGNPKRIVSDSGSASTVSLKIIANKKTSSIFELIQLFQEPMDRWKE
ncbi:uncharacterized protein LOC111613807 [Centruroides sculpturatus]|uniref:uncharacterized protein LOC111613807 n=1 Tax=Centruroides sculpturatus TaxID=218467 RepID=UPI000C6D944D|nr:uncharacterized protein LOC111613807 [Centruroides sculpturatus]